MKYILVEHGRVSGFGEVSTPPIDSIPIGVEEYELLSGAPNSYLWDDGLVFDPPPSQYHDWGQEGWFLSQARLKMSRDEKWEEIKNYRTLRKWGGVKITDSAVDYWIHSDEGSRLQHLGLVITAVMSLFNMTTFPTGTPWKTLDITPEGNPIYVGLSVALVFKIFSADAMADIMNFAAAETHRGYLNVSSDPANYDYTSGYWPTIFGE